MSLIWHKIQSGQFCIVSTETLEIFRSGTPSSTRNTTETYLLIFRGVSGNEQFNLIFFFFEKKVLC